MPLKSQIIVLQISSSGWQSDFFVVKARLAAMRASIFIDDLPIKGPTSEYLDENGNPETLPENPGIRRFIWEHAQDVHRIMHRIGHAGGTFAPNKIQLARREAVIVGQKCTRNGRLPEDGKAEKIRNWPITKTPKDVRGFLGLCGTV